MNAALRTLLAAAQRAPSGDNTQPWHFTVDEAAGRIELILDPSRDPSPMNAGQRMARLAIGAALENMLHTAAHHGWEVCCELSEHSRTLAEVRLANTESAPDDIAPFVATRVTNRRPYDARLLSPEVLARLQAATPELRGIDAHWLADRQRLANLAVLIGRADAVMFGDAAMRRAFLANVRFDRPAGEPVDFGLSLDSLELSASDRLALRCLRGLPNWAVRLGGSARLFAAHSQGLAASASGLCLLVAPDSRCSTDVLVGRALQRAWLALTAGGLAVQPMMSLLVLESVAEHDELRERMRLNPEELAELRRELRALVPEIGIRRPAFLLRFGYAPPPRGRTGRLPLAAVTSETARRQELAAC
jgi:nitroreductase